MSVDCGDEYADVHEEGVRRARKDRPCNACRETIKRGDLYHCTRTLFEGSWETISRCARCEQMYRLLLPMMGEDETCDPNLNCGHEFRQRFGEDPPPELAALAFMTPAEAQALLAKDPK